MITIDGSQKSGSGTIVRDAVPFSVLTGNKLHLKNIRNSRNKPGLRAQHLTGIEAAVRICEGIVEGGRIGSREITFRPGKVIRGGTYAFDIGTAGSTTMLALSIIPLALFATSPSHYTITGGLFQDYAPSVYHVKYVLLPLLRKMGAHIKIDITQPGYTPRGGGQLHVDVTPVKQCLKSLTLTERGRLATVKGIVLSSRLAKRGVTTRMARECSRILEKRGYRPVIERLSDTLDKPVYEKTALQAGASLAVWALSETGCVVGADMAGAPGRAAEFIGRQVAHRLLQTLDTDATVDEYIADQLIPFAALASGISSYKIPKITEHIKTRL